MGSTIDLKDCNLGLIKFQHYFVQHPYLNEIQSFLLFSPRMLQFLVIACTFKLFIYTFIFLLLKLPNVPAVPGTQ